MTTVVVGVITNQLQQIFITQRPLNKCFGGYWEFPGGKLQPPEDELTALKREMEEEVGIHLQKAEFLMKVKTANQITLQVYTVSQYEGLPYCNEAQLASRWVSVEELDNFKFPEANQAIIQLLKSQGLSSSSPVSSKSLIFLVTTTNP